MSQHCPAHDSRRTGSDARDRESEIEKNFPLVGEMAMLITC
jgi:hypothetical protein